MIVLLIGGNCSGKTTMAKLLMKDGTVESLLEYNQIKGNGLVYFGGFSQNGKMSGLDLVKGSITKKLELFLERNKGKDILLEGLILPLYTNIERCKKWETDIRVICLKADSNLIYARLFHRNNKKKIYTTVESSAKRALMFLAGCKKMGLKVLEIDTSSLSIQETYEQIKRFIDKTSTT